MINKYLEPAARLFAQGLKGAQAVARMQETFPELSFEEAYKICLRAKMAVCAAEFGFLDGWDWERVRADMVESLPGVTEDDLNLGRKFGYALANFRFPEFVCRLSSESAISTALQ